MKLTKRPSKGCGKTFKSGETVHMVLEKFSPLFGGGAYCADCYEQHSGPFAPDVPCEVPKNLTELQCGDKVTNIALDLKEEV